jgi:transcriptional regulator with XRE-family HTH domain
MKTEKKRRAQMRTSRKMLRLKQSELAALAGVSLETIVRYERCKHVSPETDARIGEAIFRIVAKRNPEMVKQAVQPFLDATEECVKILSVQPGTELAAQLEKLDGESLAELKAYAEKIAIFRRAANNFLSWAK